MMKLLTSIKALAVTVVVMASVAHPFTTSPRAFRRPPLIVTPSQGKSSSSSSLYQPLFRSSSPKVLLETTTGGAASAEVDDEPLFGPDILVIDTQAAAKEISKNWGFVLVSGTFHVMAGSWALASPVIATDIAGLSTIITLLSIGFINVVGTFYIEKGYRLQSLILGAAQIALGSLMDVNPFKTKATLTLLVAATVFCEGLYKVVLAAQNKKMQGWWGVVLSGWASIFGSAYVVKFLPLTMDYVPGVALGVGLFCGGLARVFMALAGREDANEKIG